MLQILKTCTKCKDAKPPYAFPFSTRYKVGRAPVCQVCKTTASRVWKTNNRERHNEAQRQRRLADPEKERAYERKYRAKNPNAKRERLTALRASDPKLTWAKYALTRSKDRAAKHGVPHTITVADIRAACVDVCPALNIDLVYPVDMGRKGGGRQNSPSLDRFDPALGYVLGNIGVISWMANSIKTNAATEEVEAVARWMRARS